MSDVFILSKNWGRHTECCGSRRLIDQQTDRQIIRQADIRATDTALYADPQ